MADAGVAARAPAPASRPSPSPSTPAVAHIRRGTCLRKWLRSSITSSFARLFLLPTSFHGVARVSMLAEKGADGLAPVDPADRLGQGRGDGEDGQFRGHPGAWHRDRIGADDLLHLRDGGDPLQRPVSEQPVGAGDAYRGDAVLP